MVTFIRSLPALCRELTAAARDLLNAPVSERRRRHALPRQLGLRLELDRELLQIRALSGCTEQQAGLALAQTLASGRDAQDLKDVLIHEGGDPVQISSAWLRHTPTGPGYDASLAVRDQRGEIIDLPLHSGHQSGCRDSRHAPGCLHAPDCPGQHGCGCGLPGLTT